MDRTQLSARAKLSRIAYVSAVIGVFLVGTFMVRARFSRNINTQYQHSITVLTSVEDVELSVKDMLIASKGLMLNPKSEAEWSETQRASREFKHALAIALRHAEAPEMVRQLRAVQGEYDDIVATSGLRLKHFLQTYRPADQPALIKFYYEDHFPRIRHLSDEIGATKDLAIHEAHRWYLDRENLVWKLEFAGLGILIMSLGLLVYLTHGLADSLAFSLEKISRDVISSAESIGGVIQQINKDSQFLDGASRDQAGRVRRAVNNMSQVTSAALDSVSKADFGRARSAESWFVSFRVKRQFEEMIQSMQGLAADEERQARVITVAGEVRRLAAQVAGGEHPQIGAALERAAGEIEELAGKTTAAIHSAQTRAKLCEDSLEGLTQALSLISDAVRAIEASSRLQQDEVARAETAVTHISDGSERGAEVFTRVVAETTALRTETARLLDSVEALKQLTLGEGRRSDAA